MTEQIIKDINGLVGNLRGVADEFKSSSDRMQDSFGCVVETLESLEDSLIDLADLVGELDKRVAAIEAKP